MEWFGRAAIDFTTSPKSLCLQGKDGEETNLLKICQSAVPPCQLNPLLFNGHAQTMWTAAKAHGPPLRYKRRIFEADHAEFNGSFAVDFAVTDPAQKEEADESLPPRTAYFSETELEAMGSDDERPMLVVLHGLSGGSHEVYLRHAIAPLIDSGKWEACVVISRGCANSKITTGLLYNARATWDVRQTVKWLKKTYPNRPLFGLGFSLGACIMTNYLGEEGSATPLKAAVVVANPWALHISSKMLQSTLIGHHVYQRVLGNSMRALAMKHKDELEKYTNIDTTNLFSQKFLYEFDRAYQCPTWGYPTEEAYYRDASSSDSLLAVRIPLLAINAVDDPIASNLSIPYAEASTNPFTVLCTTSLGGHLGWFEIGGGRWHGKPVCNFLNHMAFEIDLNSINSEANGKRTSGNPMYGTNFDPIRRKMYVKLNQ
ncbi:AB-hydrolase YheT [Annulohypoxylon truncatum]|uniref:AB-hydrolase YheT n=1 Tax=Annulohypoxylon truncatum TaxID=327061 RepID=UPI0020083219|nr:AB-hydrolase YheT [Annulohypoxylon truncatum]KAI1214889.1 AB-hydrolase YheT [Annulohypoxylon truncatum]